MSDAFWAARKADDVEVSARRRERLRAEKEADLLDRVGPDAAGRLCCSFKFTRPEDVCPEGECAVLDALWGARGGGRCGR